MFFYNPLQDRFKSIVGAVKQNNNFTITTEFSGYSCDLLIKLDGHDYKSYPMQKTEGGFFVCLNLPKGLYFYYFMADGVRYAQGENLNSIKESTIDYQLTVYEELNSPTFLCGGLIYQIFPDRFCRKGNKKVGEYQVFRDDWGGLPTFRDSQGLVLNNEFFGGDFLGITSKLDYLKSLGVTTIYLNPISKAYSSHRYDTTDYLNFDDILGEEKDLKEMLNEGKKRDITFIFDGVYNHTGADSVYFDKYNKYNGAYHNKDSEYYEWYTFKNYPDDYECWWDFKSLPSIKKDSKPFQRFICERVLPHYFELGFNGVRLDVVDELDEGFVKEINKVAKKYNGVVIGEVWEDGTNKIAYGYRRSYFLGGELDSQMNYPLKCAIIDFVKYRDSKNLLQTISEQINNYPKQNLDMLMNILSTHDSVRLLTELGKVNKETNKDEMWREVLSDDELKNGISLLKLAYVLAYTLYGTPSLYYGDEAGLYGNLDPYNRKCYPWGKENKELIDFFTFLGKVRKENVFKDGEFTIIYNDKDKIIYRRGNKKGSIIVCVSLSLGDVNLTFNTQLIDLKTRIKSSDFTLKSQDYLILKED